MGMGKRKRSKQDSLFIPTASLARSSSHDFYERLNQVLSADGFDDFVEDLCEPFYVQGEGRFFRGSVTGTPRGFAALVRTLESIVAAFETGGCAIIALRRSSNTLSAPNASIISIRKITFIPPSIRRRSTG